MKVLRQLKFSKLEQYNIIQKKQSFLWRIFTVKITETCELLSFQQHCLQHQLLISTVWFLIQCVFSFSLYLRSPSFSISFLSPTIKLEVFLSLIENYEKISTSFSILGLEEGKSTRNSVLGRKLKSVAHAPSSFLFRLFPVEMYASLQGTNWMLVQQKILWSFFLFWVCLFSTSILSTKAEYLAFGVTLKYRKVF